MIIEYNKFNVLLYFLLGTTITFVMRRWIYGITIILLSAFILFHRFILQSRLSKYQKITIVFPIIILTVLLLSTLYILSKSSIKGKQKLLSIIFLLASIGFSISKTYFKDKTLFNYQISNYISSLLFMVVLLTVAIIPDNQVILRMKYDEIKDDTKKVYNKFI